MTPLTAVHARRTGSIHLDAPIAEVFPLFGPVREAEWAEGWHIEPLYALTPLLEEEGAVFQTRQHGDAITVWIILRFDRDRHEVEYARVTPGLHAVTIEIACAPSAGGTEAMVTYTLTGLSEAGNAFIEREFSEEGYPHMLGQWEQAITHRLKTGHLLAHHR
jgi:hypothetical protein